MTLPVGFLEVASVELAREVRLALLGDIIDARPDGVAVYEAGLFEEQEAHIHGLAGKQNPVVSSDSSRRVRSFLCQEFQHSVVGQIHPFRREPEGHCTRFDRQRLILYEEIEGISSGLRLDSFELDICSCSITRETGTSRGPNWSGEMNATLAGIVSVRSCEPVVTAPARGGSAEVSSETMFENADQDQELSVAQQGETSGLCPNGHKIRSISREGLGGDVVASCGCDLTEIQARNFPNGGEQLVADGRGKEVYYRVEGVDEHDVGEDFRDIADDIYDALSHAYGDAVTGVIPVFSPEHDPRIRTPDDDTVELDRETAEVLLDSAGSLLDDIGSGREYGHDDAAHRENADDLASAHEDLQEELREEPEELATDGGDVVCEVPERDEHSGSVKIVLDEGGNVLVMCAKCRSDGDYRRIIDEEPGAAKPDGGQTFTADHEELMDVELSDLDAAKTALQRYFGDHQPRTRVVMAEGGRCLVVITGSATFKHESLFRETPALDITNTQADDVSEDDEDEPDLRLKVEIREVSA